MNARIQTELDRAAEAADLHRARVAAEDKRAKETWVIRSHHRAIENRLDQRLGTRIGRIDDAYVAELPLTLGWNKYDDGPALAYVSLGGVDVSEYLPPDVMHDIQSHVSHLFDEEEGRVA